MFFLPTALHSGFASKRLLCLSNGDYDGLGAVRAKELELAAVGLLGFDRIRLGQFRDGPTEAWDPSLIASLVGEEVEDVLGRGDARVMVVSFDSVGCSGHVNHVAASMGVRLYADQHKHSNKVSCWELVSDASLVSKFSSVVGAAWGTLAWRATMTHDEYRMYVNPNVGMIFTAMAAHHSQYVWFRKLYLVFARAGLWNLLRRV